MTTKLNLTIEESTVRKIKVYAERHNTSVSKLVEDYFENLTSAKKTPVSKEKFSKRAGGIITDINPDDIETAKDEYMKQKYGV